MSVTSIFCHHDWVLFLLLFLSFVLLQCSQGVPPSETYMVSAFGDSG